MKVFAKIVNGLNQYLKSKFLSISGFLMFSGGIERD